MNEPCQPVPAAAPAPTPGDEESRPTHRTYLRGRSGSGPALIYISGLDGSGELLLDTAQHLAEHYTLLRFGYRTTGAPPSDGDDYASLVRDILHELDEAGIERTLVLAESFGGAVAFQLALDAPERVTGLAIVNSFARYDRPRRVLMTRGLLRITPTRVYDAGRHLLAPTLMIGPRRDAQAAQAFRRADLCQLDDGYLRRLAMLARVDLLDSLPSIHHPVALFAADKDRVVRSVRAAREMAELLPDATLEVLPGAGHVVLPLSSEPWLGRLQELQARCAAETDEQNPSRP